MYSIGSDDLVKSKTAVVLHTGSPDGPETPGGPSVPYRQKQLFRQATKKSFVTESRATKRYRLMHASSILAQNTINCCTVNQIYCIITDSVEFTINGQIKFRISPRESRSFNRC